MDITPEYAIRRHSDPILARRICQPLKLRVNGCALALNENLAGKPLLEVLRDELGLTVAKYGCADGVRRHCGACTVLVDGRPAASCRVATRDATGKDILTFEGLAAEPDNRVIAAFAAEEALGCGGCWPGRVLAAAALLANHWRPSEAEIDKAMSGVSCRCGAGPSVGRAIRRAAGFPPG
jgi:aerobic-type carbon monoxide dehydrogenase small subunit (CoxS/CutS family)